MRTRTRNRFSIGIGVRVLAVAGVAAASIVAAAPEPAQAATPTCVDFSTFTGRGGARVVAAVSAGTRPTGGTAYCIASPSRGTGTAVRTIQQTLNACYDQTMPVDGIYGPRTQRGVRIAQQREGIAVDGVYGPQTARNIRHRVFGSFTNCARLPG